MYVPTPRTLVAPFVQIIHSIRYGIFLAILIVTNVAWSAGITVDGEIHSKSGGYVFPDGTVQKTATLSGLCGKVNAISNLTCSSEISAVLDSTSVSKIGGSCSNGDCYTCGTPFPNLEQTGGEHIYSFTCQGTGVVTVNLTNASCDLDLYVLEEGSCGFFSGTSSISCVSGDTTEGAQPISNAFSCVAGVEYHIIVENVLNSASCSYDFAFDAAAGTGCLEHCANALDDDLDGDTDCDDPDCFEDPTCS